MTCNTDSLQHWVWHKTVQWKWWSGKTRKLKAWKCNTSKLRLSFFFLLYSSFENKFAGHNQWKWREPPENDVHNHVPSPHITLQNGSCHSLKRGKNLGWKLQLCLLRSPHLDKSLETFLHWNSGQDLFLFILHLLQWSTYQSRSKHGKGTGQITRDHSVSLDPTFILHLTLRSSPISFSLKNKPVEIKKNVSGISFHASLLWCLIIHRTYLAGASSLRGQRYARNCCSQVKHGGQTPHWSQFRKTGQQSCEYPTHSCVWNNKSSWAVALVHIRPGIAFASTWIFSYNW